MTQDFRTQRGMRGASKTSLIGLLVLAVVGSAAVLHDATRAKLSAGAGAVVRLVKTGSTEPYWKQERTRLMAEYAADTSTADLVVFGDSLVAQGSWQALAPGRTVLNRGIGGDTTADMLARIDTVLRAKPKVVVLFRAHSDLEHDEGASAEHDLHALIPQAVATLRSVIERLQAAGIRVVLADIPYVGFDGDFNQAIAALNAEERRLAASMGVQTAQVAGVTGTNGRLRPEYTTDGTHLSAAGYRAALPRIRDAVARAQAAPAPGR